jgi:hypothetical protein
MQKINKGVVGLVIGLAGGLAIGVAVSLQAGPLTPPPTAASGGLPVSTMKTLDQVPATWDRKLPANNTGDPCNSSRFTCVLFTTDNTPRGVRDNETGLVWTKDANLFSNPLSLFDAEQVCSSLPTASRKGWRLPAIHELTSLLDLFGQQPALPAGHPFENVQEFYSSSTVSIVGNPTSGLPEYKILRILTGTVLSVQIQGSTAGVWCVRGR